MSVITISRQYGSGGDEIAAELCQRLGYHYFDKNLMAHIATDAGLSASEIVDFSEDNYKIWGFWDRLFSWAGLPHVVAQVGSWGEDTTGARIKAVAELDEVKSLVFVQSTIQAAYQRGNMVIVGRGGQAILRNKPDVLHVRTEASLDARNHRVYEQEQVSLAAAQDIVINHDRTATDYLKRFYDIDWADSRLYDLVIKTDKLGIEGAVQLIVNATTYLQPALAR